MAGTYKTLEELRQLLEDGILQPITDQPKGVTVVRGKLDVIRERCELHDITLGCFQAMEILFRANIDGVAYPSVMDEAAAQGVPKLIKDHTPKLLFEEWAELSELGGEQRMYITEDGRDNFIQVACGVSLFDRIPWEDSERFKQEGESAVPPVEIIEAMEDGTCPECQQDGAVKTPDGYHQCIHCGFAVEVRR